MENKRERHTAVPLIIAYFRKFAIRVKKKSKICQIGGAIPAAPAGEGAHPTGVGTFCAPGRVGTGSAPPFSFRHAEGWGNFVPRARDVSGMPLPGDVSRPRARGPFGTAQKGRKGRLGAAAPKNPVDVQQSAIVSYRRMDIVLPLHSLPGLRPCLGGHPSRFSLDTAPGAAGNGGTSPFPQVTTAP